MVCGRVNSRSARGPGNVEGFGESAQGCMSGAPRGLGALDALEQGAEVALPEALVALALDELEEERAALDPCAVGPLRLEEDLQQIAARALAVDEDAQLVQDRRLLVDAEAAAG